MWYVEDVGDVILIFFECNAIYVKDRSNMPKGCNAMYVKDIEDGKRTYTHIFTHNFLNIQPIFILQKVLRSWDSELFYHGHQILCILKYVENVKYRSNTHKGYNAMYVKDVGKEHTHTFLLNTIFNIFDIHTIT